MVSISLKRLNYMGKNHVENLGRFAIMVIAIFSHLRRRWRDEGNEGI